MEKSLFKSGRTGSVINGKNKKFFGPFVPGSLEDTAFDAMSSKLADNDGGMPPRLELGVADLQSAALPLGYGAYAALHKQS